MAIPGKENENGVYEFPYMIKPPQKTRWEAIKTGIWDPSTHEFLGRTGKSWVQILIFYLIFYIVLAALFSISMAGLYATLDENTPTYTAERSLIGTNPGLGFRPIADIEEGALIWYSKSNKTTQEKYIKLLDKFFEEYNITSPGRQSKLAPSCYFNQERNSTKACPVLLDKLGNCSGPFYGYDTNSPCIFLKLNKIFDWVPKTYNTYEKLPDEMGKEVKEKIRLDMKNGMAEQVWVTCAGEYAADKDHTKEFEYYPTKGFPAYFYPFQHKKGEYLSPLVAVEIKNPQVQSKLYAIFCLTLAMLLITCMVELYLSIQMGNRHKRIYPELQMRPIVNGSSKNVLIWYNENNVVTVDECIKLTDDFFEGYKLQPEPPNVAAACDINHPPRRGQICPLNFDNFGPCVAPFYGYYSFSPCIFLTLSKTYGWYPSYYRYADTLPPSMPKDVVKAIRNTAREEKYVWVSCEGEHDVDKENIKAINYYPSRGFPSYYFPVRLKNDEYLSHLIAVEIVNPTPGFIVRIRCQAWTKDSDYRSGTGNKHGQEEMVLHFGIMREELHYDDAIYT